MSNSSTEKIPHVHFENLDALRFIAAFSVFIFHFFTDSKALFSTIMYNKVFNAASKIADKGSLGVNFFFVLSGFLITYLILHERKYRGHFSLKKFLIRRTLRIWPLFYIVVIIGFVLFPLIFDWYYIVHDPLLYSTFLSNFDEILHGAADPNNFMTVSWSVSVEEQFYLFWGISLFLLFKISKFKLRQLIIPLYLIGFIFRWYYADNEAYLYYHTLAVSQDILTGAFIGLSLFEGRKWLEKLRSLKKIWVIMIYIIGFVVCVAKNKIFFGELVIFERAVLGAFFAFIILDQVRGDNSFFKFGKIKVFNYLGKISYGLYMYHLIVMFLLVVWIHTWENHSVYLIFAYFAMAFGGVVAVASLSYYLIEKPLLKLKPK